MQRQSDKSWLACLLLCVFLGVFGIHRFYAGKVLTGVLYLLTGGLLTIGVWYDLIMLIIGRFTDDNGALIRMRPAA